MDGENTVVQGTVDNSTPSTPETTPVSTPENVDTGTVVENFGNEVGGDDTQVQENDSNKSVEENKTPEPEVKSEEEQTVDENKEFDPDNVDFEEEDKPIYKDIEGYDLEFAKDILDFESEEAMNYIKGELSELKELGFSQAQAEKYINSHLKAYREQQAQEQELRSEKHIKEKLNEKLTKEEKGNYKSILNWVKGISQTGAFPSEWVGDLMSNPNVVKVFNAMYKYNTSNNKVQEVPQPTPKATMSIQDALAKYKSWIVKEKGASIEKTTAFVNEMKPYISDKDMDKFNQIFRAVTKQ